MWHFWVPFQMSFKTVSITCSSPALCQSNFEWESASICPVVGGSGDIFTLVGMLESMQEQYGNPAPDLLGYIACNVF